ncbi:hypothetical protein I553_6963 [Mycobacterium xenopi 4042]|uniref:Uncharacterized protein n=1 Tax=Mycobacterium xenopi 4042 TaxID=1299334 RepID=X7Z3D7_MYCXE|nr:hypothetical protein I553_6963 [Mycobacterium xenopi 4042]EUA33781.1 hypothetical protein I552_4560 [Mycobacterium xenopi 3993]
MNFEGDYSQIADAQLDALEQGQTQTSTTLYSTRSNLSFEHRDKRKRFPPR